MSDFLGRLVERSLAATASVRSRSLSIFEPRPINGEAFFCARENPAPPALEPANKERVNRISRVESLWRTNPELAGRFVGARAQSDLTSSEAVELPRASLEIRPGVDSSGNEEILMPSTGYRGIVDAASLGEGNRDASRTKLPSAPSPVRPRLDLPKEKESAVAESERGDTANVTPSPAGMIKSVPHDPTKNPLREPRAGKIIEMRGSERDAPPKLIRASDVRPVSPRSLSLKPLMPAQHSKSSPAAPSINVTIGRIEVRAMLPPMPSKTPRASAPILSLDEYLRQRAGGNRR